MASASTSQQRPRGNIESLPSGSLRVKVYAGPDPLTGKDVYLREIVPAGPKAAKDAEKIRTKLLSQVDQKRNPRTRATVNQLLDRNFELIRLDPRTLEDYKALAANHIRPLLGELPLGRIDGETLDTCYKLLRKCRAHCRGAKHVGHRITGKHSCDERCVNHQPLSDGSLRKIQSIMSGAGKRAVRWGWVGVNPFDLAEPISVPPPAPKPPTAEQAAAIVTDAWHDLDWGMLVWLAMVTGARRGELCALAWDRLETGAKVLVIRSSIGQRGGRTWEKDTKTHQQRRITIDEATMSLLVAYRRHCADRAGLVDMPETARIFSSSPDGSSWLKPDTVSQKYSRACARLGWKMNIHQLRHYSATELISAGVDVRTVAGRLGHGGGGATTLKVYTAWVSEADQRAAGTLSARMPSLPVSFQGDDLAAAKTPEAVNDDSPYKRIAADLRGAIACGAYRPGDRLPKLDELRHRYGVSFGTAQRAVDRLKSEGLVTGGKGKPTVVVGADGAPSKELADVVGLDNARSKREVSNS